MVDENYENWGRYPRVAQQGTRIEWRDQAIPSDLVQGGGFLPYGNGRSYGDVCISSSKHVLDCRGLRRFIAFDHECGLLRCESGVLFSEIVRIFLPRGWFLPVTPGTRFVTVGGAIANDVHGKNHHRAGTFGCHVHRLELMRSDGTRIICSPEQNRDWFNATIGGLGLTGVITWAEFHLKRVGNGCVTQQNIRFGNLDAFFPLSEESDESYEYTVAWVDCLSRGSRLGRGIFMRGNHADNQDRRCKEKSGSFSFPVDPPFSLVNSVSLKLFNSLYFHRQGKSGSEAVVPMLPFFYPLDAIERWNRLYGKKGFLQYQCVVPTVVAANAISEILNRIAAAGTGSFLCVMKAFGDIPSPGLLSFPRPGITLALDFPNTGVKVLKLLDSLDEVTRQAEGAVYPAKDARMSASGFSLYFPAWREMNPYIDPAIGSAFWKRVTQN